MRTFILLGVLAIAVIGVNGHKMPEEVIAKMKECCKKEHPEAKKCDELPKSFKDSEMKELMKKGCISACMFESNGCMKDGKFDKDKCLEGMAPMLTKVPDDKKEEVKTKLAECYKADKGERCATAAEAKKCIRGTLKAMFKKGGKKQEEE